MFLKGKLHAKSTFFALNVFCHLLEVEFISPGAVSIFLNSVSVIAFSLFMFSIMITQYRNKVQK